MYDNYEPMELDEFIDYDKNEPTGERLITADCIELTREVDFDAEPIEENQSVDTPETVSGKDAYEYI